MCRKKGEWWPHKQNTTNTFGLVKRIKCELKPDHPRLFDGFTESFMLVLSSSINMERFPFLRINAVTSHSFTRANKIRKEEKEVFCNLNFAHRPVCSSATEHRRGEANRNNKHFIFQRLFRVFSHTENHINKDLNQTAMITRKLTKRSAMDSQNVHNAYNNNNCLYWMAWKMCKAIKLWRRMACNHFMVAVWWNFRQTQNCSVSWQALWELKRERMWTKW